MVVFVFEYDLSGFVSFASDNVLANTKVLCESFVGAPKSFSLRQKYRQISAFCFSAFKSITANKLHSNTLVAVVFEYDLTRFVSFVYENVFVNTKFCLEVL